MRTHWSLTVPTGIATSLRMQIDRKRNELQQLLSEIYVYDYCLPRYKGVC
jgi:hypothetical protein